MRALYLIVLLPLLSSCIVVSAATTAVSVGVSAVGVATDVAVGTTKVAGKAVGAAVDAVSSDDKPDPDADKKPQGK
jgi:hypothetical protein